MNVGKWIVLFILVCLCLIVLRGCPVKADEMSHQQMSNGMVPHVHPDVTSKAHWFPSECCSQRDCYMLSTEPGKKDVKEVAGGWIVTATNEFIARGTQRDAPDENYYRCSYNADTQKGTIHSGPKWCFWAPVEAY